MSTTDTVQTHQRVLTSMKVGETVAIGSRQLRLDKIEGRVCFATLTCVAGEEYEARAPQKPVSQGGWKPTEAEGELIERSVDFKIDHKVILGNRRQFRIFPSIAYLAKEWGEKVDDDAGAEMLAKIFESQASEPIEGQEQQWWTQLRSRVDLLTQETVENARGRKRVQLTEFGECWNVFKNLLTRREFKMRQFGQLSTPDQQREFVQDIADGLRNSIEGTPHVFDDGPYLVSLVGPVEDFAD